MNTILILDSHEFEREKLKIYMSSMGKFNFIEFSSPKEFTLFQEELPHDISLIAIDIAFPAASDGFLLLDSIQKSPLLMQIPIIILTRLTEKEYQITALQKYHVKDYMQKPITKERLSESLKSVLSFEDKFFFSFANTEIINISVEEMIIQQINLARRTQRELSIIYMTPQPCKTSNAADIEGVNPVENFYSEILNVTRLSIRKTDMVFLINKRDIFVLLHFADINGATKVLTKLREKVNAFLSEYEVTHEALFYTSSVTFPDDGENLNELIGLAVKKTASQAALDEIVALSKSQLNTTRSTYGIEKTKNPYVSKLKDDRV